MQSNAFKDKFAPAVALVLITFLVCLALAGTYGVTKPIIDKNSKKAADDARSAVLPKGDSFDEVKKKLPTDVNAYHVAKNKSGVVVTTANKSFGGLITVMTGIDKDGKVQGVVVTNHNDTPGLGTKAQEPSFINQFKGKSALKGPDVKKDPEIDAVVGATISSGAVYGAVKKALGAFKELGGVK